MYDGPSAGQSTYSILYKSPKRVFFFHVSDRRYLHQMTSSTKAGLGAHTIPLSLCKIVQCQFSQSRGSSESTCVTTYLSLKAEPQGSVYPAFVNTTSAIGDGVKPIVTGFNKQDAMAAKRRNDRSRHLIKVFAWLEKKGRSPSMYPMDSLPNDYVQLEPIEASNLIKSRNT